MALFQPDSKKNETDHDSNLGDNHGLNTEKSSTVFLGESYSQIVAVIVIVLTFIMVAFLPDSGILLPVLVLLLMLINRLFGFLNSVSSTLLFLVLAIFTSLDNFLSVTETIANLRIINIILYLLITYSLVRSGYPLLLLRALCNRFQIDNPRKLFFMTITVSAIGTILLPAMVYIFLFAGAFRRLLSDMQVEGTHDVSSLQKIKDSVKMSFLYTTIVLSAITVFSNSVGHIFMLQMLEISNELPLYEWFKYLIFPGSISLIATLVYIYYRLLSIPDLLNVEITLSSTKELNVDVLYNHVFYTALVSISVVLLSIYQVSNILEFFKVVNLLEVITFMIVIVNLLFYIDFNFKDKEGRPNHFEIIDLVENIPWLLIVTYFSVVILVIDLTVGNKFEFLQIITFIQQIFTDSGSTGNILAAWNISYGPLMNFILQVMIFAMLLLVIQALGAFGVMTAIMHSGLLVTTQYLFNLEVTTLLYLYALSSTSIMVSTVRPESLLATEELDISSFNLLRYGIFYTVIFSSIMVFF